MCGTLGYPYDTDDTAHNDALRWWEKNGGHGHHIHSAVRIFPFVGNGGGATLFPTGIDFADVIWPSDYHGHHSGMSKYFHIDHDRDIRISCCGSIEVLRGPITGNRIKRHW